MKVQCLLDVRMIAYLFYKAGIVKGEIPLGQLCVLLSSMMDL